MSRLISAQLPKGTPDWNMPLKEVYLIGIMEFQFNNINSNYMHNIALMNKDTGKVFYKGMGYKFLDRRRQLSDQKQYIKIDKLPNYDKQEHELKSDLDKWFYLLKNLSCLDKIPDFLDKRVFQKIFKIAEVSKLTKEQRELYESDIKAKSDWNGGMNWAKKQAAKESAQQTALEIAASLKKEGLSVELIAKTTGLSIDEISKL